MLTLVDARIHSRGLPCLPCRLFDGLEDRPCFLTALKTAPIVLASVLPVPGESLSFPTLVNVGIAV